MRKQKCLKNGGYEDTEDDLMRYVYAQDGKSVGGNAFNVERCDADRRVKKQEQIARLQARVQDAKSTRDQLIAKWKALGYAYDKNSYEAGCAAKIRNAKSIKELREIRVPFGKGKDNSEPCGYYNVGNGEEWSYTDWERRFTAEYNKNQYNKQNPRKVRNNNNYNNNYNNNNNNRNNNNNNNNNNNRNNSRDDAETWNKSKFEAYKKWLLNNTDPRKLRMINNIKNRFGDVRLERGKYATMLNDNWWVYEAGGYYFSVNRLQNLQNFINYYEEKANKKTNTNKKRYNLDENAFRATYDNITLDNYHNFKQKNTPEKIEARKQFMLDMKNVDTYCYNTPPNLASAGKYIKKPSALYNMYQDALAYQQSK